MSRTLIIAAVLALGACTKDPTVQRLDCTLVSDPIIVIDAYRDDRGVYYQDANGVRTYLTPETSWQWRCKPAIS